MLSELFFDWRFPQLYLNRTIILFFGTRRSPCFDQANFFLHSKVMLFGDFLMPKADLSDRFLMTFPHEFKGSNTSKFGQTR